MKCFTSRLLQCCLLGLSLVVLSVPAEAIICSCGANTGGGPSCPVSGNFPATICVDSGCGLGCPTNQNRLGAKKCANSGLRLGPDPFQEMTLELAMSIPKGVLLGATLSAKCDATEFVAANVAPSVAFDPSLLLTDHQIEVAIQVHEGQEAKQNAGNTSQTIKDYINDAKYNRNPVGFDGKNVAEPERAEDDFMSYCACQHGSLCCARIDLGYGANIGNTFVSGDSAGYHNHCCYFQKKLFVDDEQGEVCNAANDKLYCWPHRPSHGCFAPGTQILMGDKTLQQVQLIQAGDKIWNPILKQALTVKRVITGPEEPALIELSYGDQKLHVSETHPLVIQNSGEIQFTQTSAAKQDSKHFPATLGGSIKMAKDIKVGDIILGEDQKFHRVTVAARLPLKKDQQVYNFELEESNGPESHYAIANGFVTGDFSVQLSISTNGNP